MKLLRPFLLSSCLLSVSFGAPAPKIEFPPETTFLAESPLPGYALASAFCYTCHSVEYIAYQPPTAPRAYWKAQVTKMQKTFGAPLPDELVEPIVDYLVRTYGSERPTPSPATSAQKPASTTR